MKRFLGSKLAQLLLVAALLACILATGTYAWTDFLGHGTVGVPAIAPRQVELVDFTGQQGEVYVINNTADEVLVRVKLAEYLAVNGTAVLPGMLYEDETTWPAVGSPQVAKYYRAVLGGAVTSLDAWKAQGTPRRDLWISDGSGWFYYAKKLAPGESTRVLLQSVAKNQFNEPVGDRYQLASALQAVPGDELEDLFALDKGNFSETGKLILRYVNGEMIEFV